jgi:methylated-DNA-[protein]-cysteine S-methyltransferase
VTDRVVFATAIGPVTLTWGDDGLRSVRLPDADQASAGAESVPPGREHVVARIRRHLAGELDDLTDVEVDLSGVPSFRQRVYEHIRTIPPGETRTYGEVATALGDPTAAQAVGAAMAANPVPIVVPCHRVLAADGLGGFSAPGGVDTKRRILVIEGSVPEPPPTLFDADSVS